MHNRQIHPHYYLFEIHSFDIVSVECAKKMSEFLAKCSTVKYINSIAVYVVLLYEMLSMWASGMFCNISKQDTTKTNIQSSKNRMKIPPDKQRIHQHPKCIFTCISHNSHSRVCLNVSERRS